MDVKELILRGENETVEFKSSFKSDAIETVVAFANTKGGVILIGVDDSKRVVGLDIGKYNSTLNTQHSTLYGDITLEKLKSKNYQSSLRNKLIAEAFYLTGNIEKYGSGFIRIEEELKKYPHVSYEFKEIANAMQITFFKKEVGGVNDVYNFIKNNPSSKAPIISKSLNIAKRTVERYIKELKEKDMIEFIGSPKTGGYVAK